jgi:hypothetical protein
MNPRFSTQVRKTHPPIASRPGAPTGDFITTEVVEGPAVGLGAWYYIKGTATPTRGTIQLQTGDAVSVLWQDSKPFMILNTQRLPGSGHDVPGGNAIVEDLFFATSNGLMQVWFRNADVLTNLKLRGDWPADPDQVKWGARGDAFFVRVGQKYFIYTFSRGGMDNPITSALGAKLLRSEFPWTTNTLIATVTYNAAVTVDTPCVWSEVDSAAGTEVFTADVASTLSRSASGTTVTEIRMVEGGFGVVDAELDYKNNLVVTVQISAPTFVIKPSGTVAKVLTQNLDSIDHQPVLDGPGSPWEAPPLDPDAFIIAVVNTTEGKLLWSTSVAEPALSGTFRQQDRGSSFIFLTAAEGQAITSNLDGGEASAHQETGNFAPVTGTAPTSTTTGTPPVPVDVGFADVNITRQSLGLRHIFDEAGLAWLHIPFGFSLGTITLSSTSYGGGSGGTPNPFGSNGTKIGDSPQAGFANIFLRYSITDEFTARGNHLALTPVRYLPHRTKDKGDLFLFGLCQQHNSAGATTAQKFSLWKYNLDTATGIPLLDWTDEPVATNNVFVTVIGASLQHVLWTLVSTFDVGADHKKRIRILLSGVAGGTKTLLDSGTVPDPGAFPDPIVKFLARNWKLPRPDLLYLLDDADTAKTNQFIVGWTSTAVILDPANIAVDGALSSKAALKNIPQGVVPVVSQDEMNRAPSVRVLENRASLESKFIDDP